MNNAHHFAMRKQEQAAWFTCCSWSASYASGAAPTATGIRATQSADEISTRSQSEPEPTGFCTTLLWMGTGREGFVYVRPFVQDIVM